MFSDHSGIKLEINSKNISGNILNTWKLNNILLNDPKVKEEIKRKIRKYSRMSENTTYKNL